MNYPSRCALHTRCMWTACTGALPRETNRESAVEVAIGILICYLKNQWMIWFQKKAGVGIEEYRLVSKVRMAQLQRFSFWIKWWICVNKHSCVSMSEQSLPWTESANQCDYTKLKLRSDTMPTEHLPSSALELKLSKSVERSGLAVAKRPY